MSRTSRARRTSRRTRSSPTASRPRTWTASTRTGWFASDFTLAEIKTLRAVQPLGRAPDRAVRRALRDPDLRGGPRRSPSPPASERGRPVGVYPETKHPTYHANLGLPLEGPLVAALRAARAQPRRRARVHPVLRAGQPAAAEPDDAGPARAARRRERHRRQRQHHLRSALRPALRLDGVGQEEAARSHVRLLHDRRGAQGGREVRRRARPVEGLHPVDRAPRHQRRRDDRRRERRRR